MNTFLETPRPSVIQTASLDNVVDAFYSRAPDAYAFWYTDMPNPPQQGFSQKGVQPSYGRLFLEQIRGKFT